MLKHKSKILFCIFLITILISTVSFATEDLPTTTSEDQPDTTAQNIATLSSSNWVTDDLYLCDKDIVIEGVVDGNVFAIGDNVTVKGEIGGDLFVIAENLNIDGATIYSAILGFAKNMNIKGEVYDIYAASNHFTLDTDGYVYRDLRLISLDATINGKIRRNAFITSNDIKFSEISDTYIGGNLNYYANNEISFPESAVAGNINFNKTAATIIFSSMVGGFPMFSSNLGAIISSPIVKGLGLVISTLVVTLLAIFLTPKFLEKVSSMKISNIFIALAIGLGVLIGIPVASIILIITIIGIPTSFALLTLYGLIIAFSKAFTSLVISSFITKKFNINGKLKFVLIALASTVVIWILSLIPFVGGIINFLNILLGLGTIVYNLFRKISTKEENK